MHLKVSLSRSRCCGRASVAPSRTYPSRQSVRRAAVPDESLYPPVPEIDESIAPVVETAPVSAVQEQQMPVEERGVSVMDRVGNGAVFALTAFLAGTFLISVGSYIYKYRQPEAQARRKLLRNQRVVRSLGELMPAKRDQVTRGMVRQLGLVTQFTPVEIFRKFLWYVLKDRKFDQAAVDDLIHLKNVMKLSNDDMTEALKERCVRIEKKFGNLMLSPEGLSEKALQRKASGRALFSKMMYLIENEQIMEPNDVLSVEVLRNIFGATEEDVNKLKIVSLQEVDLDVLDSMVGKKDEA